MRRLFLLLALTMVSVIAMQAQDNKKEKKEKEKDSLYVYGNVRDKFTKRAVPNAFATLMRGDSTIVDTAHVQTWKSYSYGFGSSDKSQYVFRMKAVPGDLIIKLEHPDYETTYVNHNIKKVSKRMLYTEGPDVLMRRIKREQTDSIEGGELGEVVVRATKVKMVWKGDTLVFNADAFNVPEGSMLDALIKQLPGVELKDNGEIYVNGKKVDNLTLNGADFFRGKNKIMLENLPYFTVKDVKVYNKQTEQNKFLGITDEDKKEYTMDVTLKKEYRGGGTANIEAGYGTDDRYKVKAFGMLFNDRIRAMMFGGLNNVNETTEYDSEGEERERNNSSGDRHFRQLGGMLAYKGSDDKFNTSVNVNSTWTDDRTESRRNSETFLTTGNSFSRSLSMNRSKPVALELTNRLDWRFSKKMYLYSSVRMDYRHTDSESSGQSLTATDYQLADSVNSTTSRSWNRNSRLNGSGNAALYYLLGGSGDAFSFNFSGNGSKTYSPQWFSQSHYRYHKTSTTDDRNQYGDSAPENYSYSAGMTFNYRLTEKFRLSPYYRIIPSYDRSDNMQYRLDQLGEAWASDGEHAFRSLPSTRDSLQLALDVENSRSQTTRNLRHETGLDVTIYGNIKKDKGWYNINFYIPFQFDCKTMDYRSQALTTKITRHYTSFEPRVYMYLSTSGKDRKYISASYYVRNRQPSIFDLIDRSYSSDPLNITVGNPNLRMQTTHTMYLSASSHCDSIGRNMQVYVHYSFDRNSFANGYTYDPETGVRTYRAENIKSGNWYFNTRLNFGRDLGKKRFFHFDSELSYTLEKSTDLANVSGSASSELSRVKTNSLHFKPSIRYQREKLSLFFQQRTQWRHYSRSIISETPLPDNTWDITWTLNGNYKLPCNFTIDTNLELRQRRGYADSEMNDNRLYWDATLMKSFKAGRWLLKLRGYDLLGQVSNLRYYVNAQGRTETWTNAMRRYALFTVAYKFTQKQKK